MNEQMSIVQAHTGKANLKVGNQFAKHSDHIVVRVKLAFLRPSLHVYTSSDPSHPPVSSQTKLAAILTV